jgi:hypothetical protein
LVSRSVKRYGHPLKTVFLITSPLQWKFLEMPLSVISGVYSIDEFCIFLRLLRVFFLRLLRLKSLGTTMAMSIATYLNGTHSE